MGVRALRARASAKRLPPILKTFSFCKLGSGMQRVHVFFTNVTDAFLASLWMNESAHSISYSNRTIRASFGIKNSEAFNMKNTLLKPFSCLKSVKTVFKAFCMFTKTKRGFWIVLHVYNMKNPFSSVGHVCKMRNDVFETFLMFTNEKRCFEVCL